MLVNPSCHSAAVTVSSISRAQCTWYGQKKGCGSAGTAGSDWRVDRRPPPGGLAGPAAESGHTAQVDKRKFC